MSHHEAVQKQFGKTAEAYTRNSTHAVGEDLKLLVEHLAPLHGKLVLDIATGGGHAAIVLARAGARVLATDITEEMLTAAKQYSESLPDAESLQITFQIAAAESLPMEAASFDAVTCRTAAHHFEDPLRFVQEVSRVLKPGGLFILIDNISPIDPELAQAMNEIEKARDPSHVEAYSVPRWVEWLTAVRLELIFLSRWRKEKDFAAWTSVAQTPSSTVQQIESFVLSLPAKIQDYLGVKVRERHLTSLAHEAVFLVCCK